MSDPLEPEQCEDCAEALPEGWRYPHCPTCLQARMDAVALQHIMVSTKDNAVLPVGRGVDEDMVEAFEVLENLVNIAIKEGATSVSLRYMNIPCRLHNPDGNLAFARVVGSRKKPG